MIQGTLDFGLIGAGEAVDVLILSCEIVAMPGKWMV
jgi:hypothetical protein